MLRIIATIGAIQILTILVAVLRSKIMAVMLGPEGVGIISLVDQVVQVVARVSAFSLPFAVLKFLSRAQSQGGESFRRTYSGLLRLLLYLTSAGAIIALTAVFWPSELLGQDFSPYRAFLIPALLAVPAIALHSFLSHVLAADGKARNSALMLLSIGIVLVIATFIGISVAGIRGFYWANLIASVSVVIAVILFLKSSRGLAIFVRDLSLGTVLRENAGILTFSFILTVSSFAEPLSYFVARYTILQNYGVAQTGLLAAGIALAASLSLVLAPTNGLYLTPILNRDIAKPAKISAALQYQSRLTLIIGAAAMPLVLFAPWLISILYSPAFIAIRSVLFVFVVAQSVALLAGVYQALIIGFDDLKPYGVIVATSQLMLGVASFLLAPRFGIIGVAIGFLISSLMMFVSTLAYLRIRHGLSLPPSLSLSIGYGIGAVLVFGAVFSRLDFSNPLTTLSGVLLYAVFLLSFLFLLTRQERRLILQMVANPLRGRI